MTTHTFHVTGLHCKACIFLTESELAEVAGIKSAKTSLKHNTITVTGEFGNKTPHQIAADLTKVLAASGYRLSVEKIKHNVDWAQFNTALPIAALFIFAFLIISKLQIFSVGSSTEVGLGAAFTIGIIASLSTCMAVVGGLVLSISANFAKEGDTKRPQIYFHIGRLVSFFVLGGVIGMLGSSFQLGALGTLIVGAVIAVVMLILGINLLDVFPKMRRFQVALPGFIQKHIDKLHTLNHTLTPLLIGALTFFLPCGFTQSMQIYSLSTGSFMAGALTMFVFALGTLPVLSLLSFSSLGSKSALRSGVFFKTAGVVVIFFALYTLNGNITAFRGKPLISFPERPQTQQSSGSNIVIENGVQVIDLEANGGYSPEITIAKANMPTLLRISTRNTYDCSASVSIPQLSFRTTLKPNGKTEVEVPAQPAGKIIRGTCSMGMYDFELRFE